jgi:hypothetical protein
MIKFIMLKDDTGLHVEGSPEARLRKGGGRLSTPGWPPMTFCIRNGVYHDASYRE